MSDDIRGQSARTSRRSATRAVRAGIATDLHHGAVVPPIHLSSTFSFDGFGKKRMYDYTRTGNPTREYLANALAELEGGEGAVVTSTGMSAVALRTIATAERIAFFARSPQRDISTLPSSISPARPPSRQ